MFSLSKPMAAFCVLVLADRGGLALDDRVALHWPEFAAAGKEAVTVRQLLCRKDEPVRFGRLGSVRQWIESVFWTYKGQLGLERHGARTIPGLASRIALRLLTLAAALWHNEMIGRPSRELAVYGR